MICSQIKAIISKILKKRILFVKWAFNEKLGLHFNCTEIEMAEKEHFKRQSILALCQRSLLAALDKI